jgi:hypothetical protein
VNFQQQQPPEHFPFLTRLEQEHIHPLAKWCLSGMFAVGGYFWGLSHDKLPLVIYIALGFVVGLLFVGLLKHVTAFVLAAAVVLGLSGATYFLLQNDQAIKAHRTVTPRLPAADRPGWLEGLFNEVKP